MEQAINMAGRQRMLSQRIVKAYSQLQMSLVPVRSRKELTDATALFESQSQSLQRYVGDEKIRKALAIVDVIWWDFKKLISVKNSQADPRDLYYLSEDLLYASDKVVQLLQDKSENQLGRLVNISGRQRMLSQRLAKLYLLQDEGLDSTSVRAALEDAQHDFSHALELLRVAPANTDEIKVELDKVILQWAWFQNVLQQEKTGDYQLIVVDASEEILRLMENITGLYSSLGQ
jgi:hypothetical protein|tara:strand:+ start:887 stop:1582 length:696 start_codon:yes stop_codon:yes gene_type:complete